MGKSFAFIPSGLHSVRNRIKTIYKSSYTTVTKYPRKCEAVDLKDQFANDFKPLTKLPSANYRIRIGVEPARLLFLS